MGNQVGAKIAEDPANPKRSSGGWGGCRGQPAQFDCGVAVVECGEDVDELFVWRGAGSLEWEHAEARCGWRLMLFGNCYLVYIIAAERG